MQNASGVSSSEPTDTLLAQLIAELEIEGDVALERIGRLDPRLAARLTELIGRLRGAQLLREPIQLGRFALEHVLGRGAMGAVWKARDPRLARDVAVKVLAGHLLARSTAVERFLREARTIAALRHPGIVTVHETGVELDVPFLVMELVDGGSLADRIASEPLSAEEACRIGIVLSEALHAAHAAGVVHRDVKPANVLLRASGAPLLADFGLACVDGDPTLTASGDLLGTPAYAAPELLTAGIADARSDVYSLGATLFHALSGRLPFADPSVPALMQSVASREAPRLRSIRPDLSVDLDSAIGCALERDPARRYVDARELGEDLGRILRDEPVRARRVRPLHRVMRWVRRRPAAAAAIAVPLLLTLVFLVGFLWWQRVQLGRYEQLADVRVVELLRAEVPELWPAVSATVPRMERWLERANGVMDRAGLHRTERDRLASMATGTVEGSLVFGDDATAWQYDVLLSLNASIEKLDPLLPIVAARTELATIMEQRTLTSAAAREAWAEAAAAIRKSPRYGGLDLKPNLGLLPLGENPQSRLWEFWHVASGSRPEIAAPSDTSRWRITAEAGFVFVLIPGGTYSVGARPASEEHPVGSPFVDPVFEHFKIESPVEAVVLDPFFLAKHEATQAQWERLAGSRPSHYDHHARPDLSVPTCPVESVSWNDATRVLSRLGLVLPTDVQWEAAYRAGTASVYPYGSEPESVYLKTNVLDLSRERLGEKALPNTVPFDDGFKALAPVDAFAPNGFGLHEMAGNVAELCADRWNGSGERPRAGDGLIFSETASRIRLVRGASWSDDLFKARSAWRDAVLLDKPSSLVGLRVAKAVEK